MSVYVCMPATNIYNGNIALSSFGVNASVVMEFVNKVTVKHVLQKMTHYKDSSAMLQPSPKMYYSYISPQRKTYQIHITALKW